MFHDHTREDETYILVFYGLKCQKGAMIFFFWLMTTRSLRISCMRTFGRWITNETWDSVFEVSSCDTMAQSFEKLLSEKYKEHFPQKTEFTKTMINL